MAKRVPFGKAVELVGDFMQVAHRANDIVARAASAKRVGAEAAVTDCLLLCHVSAGIVALVMEAGDKPERHEAVNASLHKALTTMYEVQKELIDGQ